MKHVELVFIDDVRANSSNRRTYEVNQRSTTQIQPNSSRLRGWLITLQLEDDPKHTANETIGLINGKFDFKLIEEETEGKKASKQAAMENSCITGPAEHHQRKYPAPPNLLLLL